MLFVNNLEIKTILDEDVQFEALNLRDNEWRVSRWIIRPAFIDDIN